MIFQASSGAWQPYLQARHKLFYTPTAHPQWIFSNDQRAALFADWRPNQERRYILSFVGSQTPVERGVLLRELSDYIESKGLAFDNDYPPGSHEPRTSEPRRVLWVTYGPTDARRGLNGVHYVEATRESEFVLCPLGWGGNWTHRVPESLICGAIPITPYPDRYNLGLRDGLNCLEVRRSNWREAVERALRMQLGERQRLRENILKVRAELEPENAARKVRQKLNVGA
jgi:hypothetical protein